MVDEMRVKNAVRAGAVVVGMVAAAGLMTPTAQAAPGDSWSTCSPAAQVPLNTNSTAVGCLFKNSDNTLVGLGLVDFKSPQPANWVSCILNMQLMKVNSDGTETQVAAAPGNADCGPAARASGQRGSYTPGFQLVPGTYRAKLAMMAQYGGSYILQYVATSPTVTIN
jgi:hypothetical protein